MNDAPTVVANASAGTILGRMGDGLRRPENLLLMVMIAVCLAPIWAFTYFPSSDGPAHLAAADVLRHINNPQFADGYQRYYWVNHAPMPNLAGHWILAGLMYLTPPLIAEKLLLSLYMVLLPLAFRYALTALRPAAGVLALLVFPFVYSFPLHGGFYNYCLSLAMLLLVSGYWLRNRDRMRIRQACVLAILMALLYTCHIFSLMVCLLMLGGMLVWQAMLEATAGGPRATAGGPEATAGRPDTPVRQATFLIRCWRNFWSKGLWTAAAMLPFVAVVGRFYLKRVVPPGRGVPWTPWYGLTELVGGGSMTSYQSLERWFIVPLLIVLAATLVVVVRAKFRRRELVIADGLLILVAASVLLYFRSLDGNSTQYYIPPRLGLTIYLLLALWVGAQALPAAVGRTLAALAIALTFGQLAVRLPLYETFNEQLKEYVSAGQHIQPHHSVLPLVLSPKGWTGSEEGISTTDVAPLLFATGYIAAERHVVDLANYEFDLAYFPARYRDDARPMKHLWIDTDQKEIPLPIDIAAYEQKPEYRQRGVRVDYVLMWAAPESMKHDANYLSYLDQLNKGYRPVYTSPQGHATLWQRNDLP